MGVCGVIGVLAGWLLELVAEERIPLQVGGPRYNYETGQCQRDEGLNFAGKYF